MATSPSPAAGSAPAVLEASGATSNIDMSAHSTAPAATNAQEALEDIVFGSIAGSVGKVIEYPFDTVKVRLQSQPDGVALKYKGPIDCFRQSLVKDGGGGGGWRGLYRGISAPMFGAAVETSCLFFSYRIAQSLVRGISAPQGGEEKPLPLSSLILCGSFSGAFTSLALTPIELVKCQMQVPAAAGGPSILSLVASLYRQHGLLGFWHGQLGTLIRETGGSAAWFGSYEGVSILFRQLRNKSSDSRSNGKDLQTAPLPIWQQMIAGGCAGMSYNLIFFPADTIKSRMQTERLPDASNPQSSGAGTRQSFWTVGRSIWRVRGLHGLYQGCGITVARAAPSSAFIFTVYEGLKQWFR